MDPLELAVVPPSRLLYRLVGKREADRVNAAWASVRMEAQSDPTRIKAYAEQLIGEMRNLLADGEFGVKLHTHTMTQAGGGEIGGTQQLVSMFTDFDAIARSTDGAVQLILRNAPYVLTFSVPKDGAVNAASKLSEQETEVVVPNNLVALSAMRIDVRNNPYHRQ